ncbi:MAG: tRNA (adenosine(37)-N6)-dimethylallyltransferase MiaA [Anaerolineales bacterium]|nr:tRNA (adenosine(37)-N6)-dimethylallyltransferase MiaA [Anaerolineales bacterium]
MKPPGVPAVVVGIVGPTAVGKTRVAIEVAEQIGGEIVSVDSRLLYRGLDIGTDKPSLEDRARVPHHLIDIAEPAETWSLAQFCGAALVTIDEIHARSRLPIVVGGTGQYVRALLEGWALSPGTLDLEVRRGWERTAEQAGADALHAMLAETDPVSAARIDRRNVRRVIRALEVHQITGSPASLRPRRHPVPFQSLVFGLTLPRPELYLRLDARINAMLQRGLVEEVQRLLDRGVPADAPSLSAIGYAQIVRYLLGEWTLARAIEEIRRRSRVLVRQQCNWFRPDDPEIHWVASRPGVERELVRLILRRLPDGSR